MRVIELNAFVLVNAGVIHRPHCLVGVGTALVSLFPHNVRERSADWRTNLVWHLGEGARVPLRGTPPPGAPLWRLPPRDRLVGSEPETFISVIRAAFAALHPDRPGLLAKAALRSKGGREPRATRTSCARDTGARAPRLLRQPRRP